MSRQPSPSHPWLQSYPAGIAAEIEPFGYPSLPALFAHCVQRFGDRPALSNFKVTLSYRQLDALQQRFSHAIQGLGLVKGDRIALMMPNVLQYPVCLLGALRAGLVVVNVNPLYTARELRHQLLDADAKAIVVLENFAHVVAAVKTELSQLKVIVSAMGDLLGLVKGGIINTALRWQGRVPRWRIDDADRLPRLLAKPPPQKTPSAVAIEPSDLAFLQYTGGTTGASRGAMLCHANMLANIQQASTWIAARVRPGEDIVITALPLYHIFALMANLFTYMYNGALSILITNPRDTTAFIKNIRHQRFTAITGVNTLFNALLNHPRFAEVDFSALRLSLGGGMALQRHVAERWKALTGCPLIEAYGLTETSPAVCINPMELQTFNGSVGLPLPSTEVCVRSDDGALLASASAGELWVRGPQVMRGYWRQPIAATAENAAATDVADAADAAVSDVDADGWFATGDIATIDEQGFVRIVDRKKDMINISGFNVYPNEVESVIASHPQVREVGVVGILDDAGNEQIKAVVISKTDDLDAASLQQWCRQHLTPYKIPQHIEFVAQLPKTSIGKILRRALKGTSKNLLD